MSRLHTRPPSLAGLSWVHPEAAERARRSQAFARLKAAMNAAVRKTVRDIVKRRARALLADPAQLEMIGPGLSQLRPAALIARIREVRRATRSLRTRPDPLVGRINVHNLNAAELAARLMRRTERREALRQEAA
jgi:hypothetical protein